jgi:RNA polymerase sigma factor (sigma-70 family)
LADTVPEALASLNDKERAVIEVKYWTGWSDRRVGAALDVDHKTVRRRHDEGIAKLRQFYRDDILALAG